MKSGGALAAKIIDIDRQHRLRNTSTAISFVVHANSVRMRRITHHREPSKFTCSIVFSCPTTMFGPTIEKEEAPYACHDHNEWTIINILLVE
jgi:hypothetical protein